MSQAFDATEQILPDPMVWPTQEIKQAHELARVVEQLREENALLKQELAGQRLRELPRYPPWDDR